MAWIVHQNVRTPYRGVGSGLSGVSMKGMLPGESFSISRNWLAREARSLWVSKAPGVKTQAVANKKTVHREAAQRGP